MGIHYHINQVVGGNHNNIHRKNASRNNQTQPRSISEHMRCERSSKKKFPQQYLHVKHMKITSKRKPSPINEVVDEMIIFYDNNARQEKKKTKLHLYTAHSGRHRHQIRQIQREHAEEMNVPNLSVGMQNIPLSFLFRYARILRYIMSYGGCNTRPHSFFRGSLVLPSGFAVDKFQFFFYVVYDAVCWCFRIIGNINSHIRSVKVFR